MLYSSKYKGNNRKKQLKNKLHTLTQGTTLQKFTDRINIMILGKILSSCILFTNTNTIFAGIDSTGFKITNASSHYTNKINIRKKYAKLSIGADVLKQIICNLKIRRAPTRHDIVDFTPIITRITVVIC